MKEKKEKGFIPVMLTPFKENGEIDFEGLTTLTQLYIKAGAKGLFANCQSSEMFELNEKERLQIVRHVLNISDGALPVVAVGNFGDTIEQQAQFIHRIYETGVRAVILVTSLIAKEHESAAIFEERVFQLFSLTGDIPLGFYECPEPYKRVLTAEQLHRFVATGRIIYHKDTCLGIDQVRGKLEGTDANSSFGLYDAYAVNAVASLEAGAAGISCIQGNFFPELIVWLCDNYNNPHTVNAVKKVQQFLVDHMDVIHRAYPTVAKYFLQKSGIPISNFTRTKTEVLSEEIKNNVNQLFERYNLLREEIRIAV